MGIKYRIECIKYTCRHKKAFLKVEKELLGRVSLRGLMHDIDKVFLYMIFNKQKAHNIHRKYARHHINNMKTENDKIHGIIDWECARYTKPDKPLSAIEFIELTMCDRKHEFLTTARRLGL